MSDLLGSYYVLPGRGKGHSEACRRLARRFVLGVRDVERYVRRAEAEGQPKPGPTTDYHELRASGLSHTEAVRNIEADRRGGRKARLRARPQ